MKLDPFVSIVIVVAGAAAVVGVATLPTPAETPQRQTVTITPSVCERALAKNLTVAQQALMAYGRGDDTAGRSIYLGGTEALPKGCS